MSATAYACCYDASALAKLYLPEPGSDIVRGFWNSHSTKYATPFCVYETLTILKVAYVQRRQLTKDEYLEASVSLAAWASASSRHLNEPDLLTPEVFMATRRLAGTYDLDLSDAFQLYSVKFGFFSVLTNDSRTLLVSADAGLVNAARMEGLRAWNVMKEAAP